MKKQTKQKKGKKLLPILLAFCVLLSGQGMTVVARTVSENEVMAGKDGQPVLETEPEILMEEEAFTESVSGNETVSANEALIQTGAAGEGIPANPIYYCDTDYTDWSYVYFGSYPQTEVTDKAVIEAIDDAIAARKGDAELGTDVWVNGTKYCRINIRNTNYYEYFDDVESNGYRYFKWERIKWKVLQNDGNTLFLVADKALDCKAYNEKDMDITWENCTLRSWLNNTFYNRAFSSKEQNVIVSQTVVNEDNLKNGTEGGNNTNDKVYLLSMGEVTNIAYGFYSIYLINSINIDSASCRVKASDYANARGVWRSKISDYAENCFWWLRSSGYDSNSAMSVSEKGNLSNCEVSAFNQGVCPALHINLSSAMWSVTDDGTSGDGGEEITLTGIQATKTKTTYAMGEALNVDDLKVTAYYQFGSQKELPAGSYTTNRAGIDMNTPGDKELIVSYTESGITETISIIITVNQPVEVTKLSITAPSKKLAAGKKVKLTVKATPSNAANKAVTWKTSNKKYATIDKNGKLTLKKAGIGKTVTITATAKDGSGKKATIKIKIMKHAVKSIKLKAPAKTLKTGKSMTVKATVNTTGKSVNKTLKWSSSNTKYATVNSKGKVTAKKAGKGKTVTITAASTDGSNKKAKVKIKIK